MRSKVVKSNPKPEVPKDAAKIIMVALVVLMANV